MKKNYCKPCAIIMQEKYTLTPLPCGKDYKAVCARCKRTRFGQLYEQRRKAVTAC